MKDYQTTQKDQSRGSDLANRRSKATPLKKSQKTPQKSLIGAFNNGSEDASPVIEIKEQLALPPIAETFSDLSIQSESSNLTPSSAISGNKSDVTGLLVDCHEFVELNGSKVGSDEVYVFANLIKEARLKNSNSSYVDCKSKKLLDSLIKITVHDLFSTPQDRDSVVELVSKKHHILFASLVICIFAVSVILFFYSEPQQYFIRPPPT